VLQFVTERQVTVGVVGAADAEKQLEDYQYDRTDGQVSTHFFISAGSSSFAPDISVDLHSKAPTPSSTVCKDASKYWAHACRNYKDRDDDAHVERTVFQLNSVANDAKGALQDSCGSKTRDGSTDDKHYRALGYGADNCAD
jgi:hypothetical protein